MSNIPKVQIQAAIDYAKSKKNIDVSLQELVKQANIYAKNNKIDVVVNAKDAQKLLREQETIQNRLAQTVLKRNKEAKQLEANQSAAINRNLELQYSNNQKLLQLEKKKAEAARQTALQYTQQAQAQLKSAMQKYSSGDTVSAQALYNKFGNGVLNFKDLSNVSQDISKYQAQVSSTIATLQASHAKNLASINAEKRAEENLQKQRDAFAARNISNTDYEIKKREQSSKAYAKQIQSQMQSDIALTNIQVKRESLTARLDAMVANNSKGLPLYGKQISEFREQIQLADNVKLNNLSTQIGTIEKNMQAAGVAGDTFAQKIQKNIVQFARFMISATITMGVLNSFRALIKNVVELDASITELRKVVDLSGSSLDEFKDKAFALGKQIGRTGKEVIDAVTTFKKAGFDLNDSLDLAESALVMTNVGDGINNVTEASSALIAVLKGFQLDDSMSMNVVSMINEVANNAAIDFENITEGLRRVSGTLAQTGTSVEQTIGLITGGFGQLRDSEMVSSGLIMISQRLRGIDEDGQAIDGLAPKLAKEFKEIANIDIEDENGNLRNTYDILADMARVFPTLTSKQRQYLGELAAGNRQVKVLNAILSGWKDVESAIDSATNSLGSAEKENAVFMDSIQGKLNSLKSAFQELSQNTLDSQWVKNVVDFGTFLVTMVDKIGLLNIALAGTLIWLTKFPIIVNAITTAVTAFGVALNISTGGAALLLAGLVTLAFTIGTDLFNATNNANNKLQEQQQIVEELTTKVHGLKSEYDSLNDKQNRTPDENKRLALLKEELATQEALLKIEKQREFDTQYGKQTIEFKGAFGYSESTDYDPLNKIKYDIQAYQDTLSKLSNASNLGDYDQLNEKLLKQKQALITTNSELLNYKSVLGQLPPEFENILNILDDVILTEGKISPDNSGIQQVITTTEESIKVLSALDDELSSLSKAFAEQQENGRLSVSTILDLVDAGYAAALSTDAETGAVTLNKDAYLTLVQAKIAEQKVSLQLLKTDLTDKYAKEISNADEAAKSHINNAKAMYEEAKATYGSMQNVDAQISALNELEANLGKVVTGNYAVASSAKSAAKSIEQAYSSANSAINSLLSTTIAMLKQKYQDADESAKKSIQSQIDLIQERMDKKKKEAEDDYKIAQERIQDQKDLLKAQKDTRDYEKSLTEKTTNKAKLKGDLEAAKFDTSEAGLKRQRDLEDQIAKATTEIDDLQYERSISLSEDALDKELDRIKEIHDSEIESIEDTYNRKIERLEDQLQRVEDNAMSEADIRQEAMDRINRGGKDLYDDLIAYNKTYGDGINASIDVAWQNAYLSLEAFGGKQFDVLTVLNDLAIKMNDFDIATQDAAKSMQNMADAIRDKNDAIANTPTTTSSYKSKSWDDISGASKTRGLSSYFPQFKEGGEVNYTGLAMVHGGEKSEMMVNNSDVAKLYELIHNTSSLSIPIANSIIDDIRSKFSGLSTTLSGVTNNNNNLDSKFEFNFAIQGDATAETVNAFRQQVPYIISLAKKEIFATLNQSTQLGY